MTEPDFAKTVYLIRHGETEYNLQGIVQGSGVDTDLNDTGRRQAAAFHAAYGHLPFEAVLTSALKRTHQTVRPFIDAGLPWHTFPEINELSWGVHEGRRHDNIGKKEFRRVTEAWQKGRFHEAIEGGESAAQLQARLSTFVDHLRQRPEKLLLVCSHGRAMRGLICVLLGRSLRNMEDYSHHNTGLWRFSLNGEDVKLDLRNDIRHLTENHPAER